MHPGIASARAVGPRNPDPPTLATRGSLLRGAWEPRQQTAPQEQEGVPKLHIHVLLRIAAGDRVFERALKGGVAVVPARMLEGDFV